MTNDNLHRLLKRFIDIRPEETLPSLLMCLYFFLLTTTAYIIKPVKVSLYLEWLKPERLPWAYLLTALIIGFVVTFNIKLLDSLPRHLYITFSLLFYIFSLLVFWLLFQHQARWLSMVYWIWAEIFTVTSVTQFWILVNDLFNPRQAKRLVGFLVSGGLLGGILGSALASSLAQVLGTENLLLICPFLLLGCLLIVRLAQHRPDFSPGSSAAENASSRKKKSLYGEGYRLLKHNRYLLQLSGVMASAIIVTTLVDFQFNSIVEMTFSSKDQRTFFLGAFFTILLIFSYLLHIFVTNSVLKKFGFRVALLIAPVFLLAGAAAVFLIPLAFHIYWAVLVKGADKSLAHSLNQSVRELLYIPIAPDIKYKAKMFIDMFINKFAKGLAALLLLICLSVFHFSLAEISLLTIVFCLLWVILDTRITHEYIGSVKKNLQIKWKDADQYIMDNIDVDMTKLVFDTLQSKERSSVLYAMNLFDLVKSEKMTPEVKNFIDQKSNHIKACSMDALLELDGEALLPALDDGLENETLAEQIDEIMSQDVYQEVMQQQITKVLHESGGRGETARMETAKALGMMAPSSSLIRNLTPLLKDDSVNVVLYALESAGKLKIRDFVPLIISKLKDPKTRRPASRALTAYGEKVSGTLRDYLADTEEDLNIRRSIPDILAQYGSQRAADVMSRELKRTNADLEADIIEALFKLRTKNPELHFPNAVVSDKSLQLIKKAYLILLEMHNLQSEPKKTLLAKELESNLGQTLKHVFELISLIYNRDDIIKAYQNISSGNKKSIDYSLELLENLLTRELRDFLLPLIDDIAFEEKAKRCKRSLKILEKMEST